MSSDTSAAALRRYFVGLRAMTGAQRLQTASRLSQTVRDLAAAGVRQRDPNGDKRALGSKLAMLVYGKAAAGVARRLAEGALMADSSSDRFDPVDIAILFGAALEQVGAPWFLGGSLASSLQGEPRATNDIDIVAAMDEAQARKLVAVLGSDFEADEEDLLGAVRTRRSTNVFFLPAFTKIDVFVCGIGPFDTSEMARRQKVEVRAGRQIWIKSAEDSVLRKLLWYRAGGEASSSQWRDVVAILRVSGDGLDRGYLEGWSQQLGVDALLARAWSEASLARE